MDRRRPQRDERGVVLVIVILALALIAALIFYVFNMGQHVKNRVETQHAADSAAISGAGWVARSLNTVAANNVQSARLISLVNVLDASDEALHPAYHQADKMYHGLDAVEPGAAGGDMTGQEAALVSDEMRPIIEQLREEYRKLAPLKQRFAAPSQPAVYATPTGTFDVRQYTFYNGGEGRIWQALEGLSAYSEATMENLDRLAQRSAREMGRANLDDEHGTALMVPHLPEVPWETGNFTQFERPVRQGLLPENIDHKRLNRGPFDVLFGWRREHFKRVKVREGVWDDGPDSRGEGPDGPGGQGPRDHSGGHWERPPRYERYTTGYKVYGTHRWMKHDIQRTHFRYNPYFHWRDRFANWKQQYLFDDKPTQQHHRPVWRTDWSRINGVAGGGQIKKARYFTMRIESEVPHDDYAFLAPGTYQIATDGHLITIHGDWQVSDDPCDRDTNNPAAWQRKLELWRQECDQFQNMTGERKEWWASAKYEQIGEKAWRFESKMKRNGQQVYQYIYYFLIGADIGKEHPVRNPHTFFSKEALPGPVVLDRAAMPVSRTAAEDEVFSYLAIAQERSKAAMWPSKFDQHKPYPATVGIAQARVFNNHSYDLWTQMWHAQLEPVQDYPAWVERYSEHLGDATRVDGVEQETLDDLNAYLKRTEDLAEVMLSH
jgi:hypothetical protein